MKVTKCQICGESLKGERAEMYDPKNPEKPSVICHPDCGLWKKLEQA